jgi:sirohydrochlorin ferrochelatase
MNIWLLISIGSLLPAAFGFIILSSKSTNDLRNFGVKAASQLDVKIVDGTGMPHKVAVILVDHGSRKAEANDMLMGLASKYKKLYNVDIVEAAHMELSEPSIATAFRKCVDQGATNIICHPFFLSKGRHVQEDIPDMMKAAAAEHDDIPHLEYSITEPLGVQEKILELIHESITNVVDESLL